MIRKILIHIAEYLLRVTYKKLTLDQVNKKLIRPVAGLIINGEQYYEFVNLADMPEARFVHFLDFDQEFTLGMDRETVLEYCDELRKANNKADASRIGSLVFMLEDSLKNCTPVQAMYNLAALVYFTEQEDLRCFDADVAAAKIKQFQSLKSKGFFFGRLLEQGLKIPGDKLPADMNDYLKRSVVKLSAYERIRSGAGGSSATSAMSASLGCTPVACLPKWSACGV